MNSRGLEKNHGHHLPCRLLRNSIQLEGSKVLLFLGVTLWSLGGLGPKWTIFLDFPSVCVWFSCGDCILIFVLTIQFSICAKRKKKKKKFDVYGKTLRETLQDSVIASRARRVFSHFKEGNPLEWCHVCYKYNSSNGVERNDGPYKMSWRHFILPRVREVDA